jgi:hypothetical protein
VREDEHVRDLSHITDLPTAIRDLVPLAALLLDGVPTEAIQHALDTEDVVGMLLAMRNAGTAGTLESRAADALMRLERDTATGAEVRDDVLAALRLYCVQAAGPVIK